MKQIIGRDKRQSKEQAKEVIERMAEVEEAIKKYESDTKLA